MPLSKILPLFFCASLIACPAALASEAEELDAADLGLLNSRQEILRAAIEAGDALPPDPGRLDRRPGILHQPIYESEILEASEEGAMYLDRIHLTTSEALRVEE